MFLSSSLCHRIEKKVIEGEQQESSSSSKSGGIDNVLDLLKGPKVVSTVTKSSMDWDNYKEVEGLTDDLTNASKDGYLTKKDFSNRCDVRSYENDKDARMLTKSTK